MSVNYVLKIANLYQIFVWLVTAFDYTLGIYDTIWPARDTISLLSSIAIIGFSILIIWSNIFLLSNRERKNQLLNYLILNKWLNFIQIINFSLMGVSLYIIIGVHAAGYYMYDQVQKLSTSFSFYKLTIHFSYSKSNIIFLGLNLIPLLLFILFNKNVNEYNEKKY